MRKQTAWWLVILVLSLAASMLHAVQPVIVLKANESFPYWSQKLPFGGMCGEIVQAISKEMGMETRIEFVPLKRIIIDKKNNPVGNPLFYMEYQDFTAIIPIAVSYSAFFSYRDGTTSPASQTAEAKGKRIGILKGTISNIEEYAQFGQFEESFSSESLFKKLKAGRLDTVIELNLVGHQTISRLFPDEVDNFELKTISNSVAPIAIMIDSKYPDGVDIGRRYREGLHRIIKNGVHRKILQKYYGKMPITADWYDNLFKYETIYTLNGEGQ